MNPDLLRQRRNLIAVSAVLLVFDFSNVKITKVSVLGTELLVGNAQVLMVCAWVLWGYFLLRYYQYWKDEENRLVTVTLSKKLIQYARSFAQTAPIPDGRGGVFDNFYIRHGGFLKWTLVLKQYNKAKNGWVDADWEESLPPWRMAVWALKSVAFVCFQTPHVTDHILPFMLAFAAPVVSIFTKLHPHVAEPILTQATRCPFYF